MPVGQLDRYRVIINNEVVHDEPAELTIKDEMIIYGSAPGTNFFDYIIFWLFDTENFKKDKRKSVSSCTINFS